MNPFTLIRNALNKRVMAQKGMLNNSRKVNRKRNRLAAFIERSPLTGIFMLLIILAVSVYSMLTRIDMPPVPRLVSGQLAPFTIYAAFPFSFEDRERTALARNQAAGTVPIYYRISGTAVKTAEDGLYNIINETEKRYENQSASHGYAAGDNFAGNLIRSLDAGTFENFAYVVRSHRLRSRFIEESIRALNTGMIPRADKESMPWLKQIRIIDALDRVREAKVLKDVPTVREAAAAIAEKMAEHYPKDRKINAVQDLTAVIEKILEPGRMAADNLFTKERLENVLRNMRPVMTEVRKGVTVIRKDETVTPKTLEKLDAYAARYKKIQETSGLFDDFSKVVKSFAICLVLMVFNGIYIYHIHPEVVSNNRSIWLLGLITVLGILLNIYASKAFLLLGELESIPPWLMFIALPLGFAPIVLSSIFGMRSALYVGLYIAAVAALSDGDSFNMLITGLIVSSFAAFSVRKTTNYRSHFLYGALTVSLATLFTGALFVWRDNDVQGIFPWLLIIPFGTGVLTAMTTQMTLYLSEVLFDVATNMSLLLYSDYNHPLLKRLQFEAPGTYHHSLVVSMLAEAAAEHIGANPIRARVSALFHDVGKLSHPEYFTENSRGEDKHKELNPKMSALIILNHVKEGLELARKFKMKRLIRDAIEQHHGTDLVYFFYKKAKDSGEEVDEHDFRYQGPTPRSKEIAILSLADACEAASRSLLKPTHGKISELVTEIIQKRLRDGQLDSANLTFQELNTIRNSFIKTLTSMLHSRIAYPKEEKADENDLFVAETTEKTSEFEKSGGTDEPRR